MERKLGIHFLIHWIGKYSNVIKKQEAWYSLKPWGKRIQLDSEVLLNNLLDSDCNDENDTN